MENTQNKLLETSIKPIWDSNYSAIVISCSNEFVPYFCVCMQSILEHTSKNHNYDFVIFEQSISNENKKIIKDTYESENVSIRFYNPSKNFDKSKLYYYAHVSIETYFKLSIPIIMKNYKKVLFLDADIIVEKDIAELYNTDLEGKSLGACPCCMWNGLMKIYPELYKKTVKTLKIKDVHMVLQGGVLLIDIDKWNNNNYPAQLIKDVSHNKYITHDQGALNKILYGDVILLEPSWNHEVCTSEFKKTYQNMDATIKTIYEKGKDNPYIIHYNGFMKPWKYIEEDLADKWWHYAYKTPYYETMLAKQEEELKLYPAFKNCKNVIAMGCSNLYAPYLSVYLLSILNFSDDKKFYDIVILESDISDENKKILKNLISKSNVSLRFYNVGRFFDHLNLYITYNYFAKQCYYRLAMGKVFCNYKKIIYTDIDIIANGDIAELFNIDMGDNIIGASEEILWTKENRNGKKQLGINIDNYVNKLVGIDGKYYNTGVMLVDIQKYNEFSNFEDLIEIALKNKYINIEQDVLNNVFRKHFYKLPSIYNFEIYQLIYDGTSESYKNYMKDLDDARLIHYLTIDKVWNNPDLLKAHIWWEYARKSPFYEQILLRMNQQTVNNKLHESFNKVLHYNKNLILYYKYKILGNFMFGKTKERYKLKKRSFKEKIKHVRQLKKQINIIN